MIYYVGDLNPECGGVWIDLNEDDLKWGFARVVGVVNLGNAAGAEGLLLVEDGSVAMPNSDPRWTRRLKPEIRKALASWGWDRTRFRGMGKVSNLILIAHCLWAYGATRSVDQSFTVAYAPAIFRNSKETWNGWCDIFDKNKTVALAKDYDNDIDLFVRAEIFGKEIPMTECYFDPDYLAALAREMIQTCPDSSEILVGNIASEELGIHQAETVINYFGLELDPSDEFAWEEIERFTSRLSDHINKRVPIDGWVWTFGHTDWGDYGLLLVKD